MQSFVERPRASCEPEKAGQSCCPQRTDSRLSVDTVTGVDSLQRQHPHEYFVELVEVRGTVSIISNERQ